MNNPNFETMRAAMVASQLRTTGVSDPAVVEAMSAVPREQFVPESRRAVAYADIATPVATGRALLPPMVLGQLLTEALVKPGEKALVVGGTTGYAAAVLAEMGVDTVLLESDKSFAAETPKALKGRVTQVTGELEKGHAKGAPYDLILIDGAVEVIPQALIEQLADDGRLIAVKVGEDGVGRAVIGHKAGSAFGLRDFADAPAAERLPGFARPRGFTF